MLNLPTTTSASKIFATAIGTFSSNEALKLENDMLPCLSTNQSFTIELMVIPKECCIGMSYGVIIGQESMRLLDLDASFHDNISPGATAKQTWSLETTGLLNTSSSKSLAS